MIEESLAYINPQMLKWAREQSGFSLEEAVKKDLNPEKLKKAEEGKSFLTFKQFLIIAKRYKRPPAFFYLNKPPKEDLIDDFRTLKSKEVKFTPLLRDQILLIKEKRDLAVKFQTYDREYDYSYIKSVNIEENPEDVANSFIKLLDIDVINRKSWKTKFEALNSWKVAFENIGVLIFQISKINVYEMRGFSISEIPYPTIVLNRDDSHLGRIFTLIHEFCHLMLKKGGICTLEEKDEKASKIEQFCNAVAGAVLVPMNPLLELVKDHSNLVWEENEFKNLINIFWASYEVILRRLLTLNKTNKIFYQKKREEWSKIPPSERKGGFERVYEKILRTHPSSYIKIVFNAMQDNNITLHDVSYYLGMNLKHLDDLKRNL